MNLARVLLIALIAFFGLSFATAVPGWAQTRDGAHCSIYWMIEHGVYTADCGSQDCADVSDRRFCDIKSTIVSGGVYYNCACCEGPQSSPGICRVDANCYGELFWPTSGPPTISNCVNLGCGTTCNRTSAGGANQPVCACS